MSTHESAKKLTYDSESLLLENIRQWLVSAWTAELRNRDGSVSECELAETKSPNVYRASILMTFTKQRLDKTDFFLARDYVKAYYGAQSEVTLKPFRDAGLMRIRVSWFIYAPR